MHFIKIANIFMQLNIIYEGLQDKGNYEIGIQIHLWIESLRHMYLYMK